MNSADDTLQLDAAQVKHLKKLLSDCRHNVNNNLSLVMSALELIQLKPESTEKMIRTALDQSQKITSEIEQFGSQFERLLREAQSHS